MPIPNLVILLLEMRGGREEEGVTRRPKKKRERERERERERNRFRRKRRLPCRSQSSCSEIHRFSGFRRAFSIER